MIHHQTKIFAGLVSLLVAATTWADEPAEKPYIDVVILAGQSNMSGAGFVDNLPEHKRRFADPVEGLRYRAWVNESPLEADWVSLKPRLNIFIGPEMMFGHVLSEHRDVDDIAIFKYSVNGSSLQCDWNPDICGENLLRGFESALSKVRFELDQQGRTARFAGLIWVQGEADCGASWAADLYATNLKNTITAMRVISQHPALPVVLARVAPRTPDYQYFPLMHQRMREVAAADPRVATVTCIDLELKDDQVHLKAEAFINLGARLADTFIGLRPFEDIPTPQPPCRGDLNWDDNIDSGDVGLLFASWGVIDEDQQNNADLNEDGTVNSEDLGILLLLWEAC